MTPQETVIAWLKASAEVTAQVGSRIFGEWVDERSNLWPAVTVRLEQTATGYHAGGSDGLRNTVLIVTAWARKRTEATAAGQAIVNRLDGQRGMWFSTEVLGAFCEVREVHSEEPVNRELDFYGHEITLELLTRDS